MATARAPRAWKKRVLLNVISLGRVCASALEAEEAGTEKTRRGQIRENELLRQELRLKDARMERVPARRRPHYSPMERMEMLELKAARGWSTRQTAQRFHVSETTIASWLRKADDPDSDDLLQLREPMNKFPDLIRLAVQRLKTLCPRLGKDKIAEMFCRAGVEISSSTVGRIVKEPGRKPPPATRTSPKRSVSARCPNDVWLIDLTAVPIGGFGFWISWLPFSVPQCWPFCYWVAAIVDVYSRRVQGFAVFQREPTAKRIRSLLKRVTAGVEVKPRYLISDHDPVFDCAVIRDWCGSSTRQRFGAVGEKGSIAIVERFFLTFKEEFTRMIRVPLDADAFRREARYFVEWFNRKRPHASLDGRTPQEAHDVEEPKASCSSSQILVVEFYKGRRHLPVLMKRKAG